MMVEGGALEVSEEDVVEALTVAQDGIKELIGYQDELLEDRPARSRRWTGPRPPSPKGSTTR